MSSESADHNRPSQCIGDVLGLPQTDEVACVLLKWQVGTYNVNGRLPPAGMDLSPWLNVALEPDIVAVVFQEIVPLNASNVVMGASLDAAAAWDRLIQAVLNKDGPPSPGPRENGHVIIRSRSGSANLHDAAPDFFSLLDQEGLNGAASPDGLPPPPTWLLLSMFRCLYY